MITKAHSTTGATGGVAVRALGGGEICAVSFLATAGTDTCHIYDNASAATGTVLFACLGSATIHIGATKIENGLYVVQTGTSSISVIHATV